MTGTARVVIYRLNFEAKFYLAESWSQQTVVFQRALPNLYLKLYGEIVGISSQRDFIDQEEGTSCKPK